MNSITRVTTFGLPAIVVVGFAWVSHRIIRNENEIRNRELELRMQLDKKLIKTF